MVRTTTDGGNDEPTIADVADNEWLEYTTDTNDTFKIRHERSISTTVEDGVVVHKVVESYADDAHPESVAFTGRTRCPIDGHDTERDTGDGVVRFRCREDGCPFEATKGVEYVEDDAIDPRERDVPTFYRVTVPDAGIDDPDINFEDLADGADEPDEDAKETVANIARVMALGRFVGGVTDRAHVSAEYDGDIGDDDREKVAEAYIDTFECGACGDEVEAPAKRDHKHFGDVCPSCVDATVWSVDDADLPDDVAAKFDEHASFTPDKVVDLLRDVVYWPNYIAAVDDKRDDPIFTDTDDVEPEDVGPIKTGEQGRRSMGRGDTGKKGTGLRRPKGFAHNFRHFRTVLRDAVDVGLIRRVDDADTDVDDPDAAWEATDKGRRVFDELATCRTCGDDKAAMIRTSTYKVGRSTKRDFSLALACPDCDDLRSASDGALVLESSSTDWSLAKMPGVEYDF